MTHPMQMSVSLTGWSIDPELLDEVENLRAGLGLLRHRALALGSRAGASSTRAAIDGC